MVLKLIVNFALLFFLELGNGEKSKGFLDYSPFSFKVPQLVTKPAKDEQFTKGEECDRKCNGTSLTCYFKLHVERFSILEQPCDNCSLNNVEACDTPQCITADGFYRGVIVYNRQYPGPAITVCRGDKLVIDMINQTPDLAVTTHFHGVRQVGSPFYDGVPYVTQCPVPPASTFRYRFTVEKAGTYFYHSHQGVQSCDGLTGPLVVQEHEGSSTELYDDEHVLMVTDWTHRPADQMVPGYNSPNISLRPDTFLVNGRGLHWDPNSDKKLPPAIFKVEPGLRYRFRLIGGTFLHCGTAVKFQNHKIQAISSDGDLKFEPTTVDSVTMNSGERFDVILTADQKPASYYIHIEPVAEACSGIGQVAILRYGDAEMPPLPPPPVGNMGSTLNPLNTVCDKFESDHVCLTSLKGESNAPSLGNQEPVSLFVNFGFYVYKEGELFKPDTYDQFGEFSQAFRLRGAINDITMAMPSSPLLSQLEDIPSEAFCQPECYDQSKNKHCVCPSLYEVPYEKVVNLIVSNLGNRGGVSHPFHLHGFNFHVIDSGFFYSKDKRQQQEELQILMEQLNHDNVTLKNRPMKDTVSIPAGGYVRIRFVSDNPGYWVMHCHFLFHAKLGMLTVLKVGNSSHWGPVPAGFPKCANYIP